MWWIPLMATLYPLVAFVTASGWYKHRHTICYTNKFHHSSNYCDCGLHEATATQTVIRDRNLKEIGLDRVKLDRQWKNHKLATMLQSISLGLFWPPAAAFVALAGFGYGLFLGSSFLVLTAIPTASTFAARLVWYGVGPFLRPVVRFVHMAFTAPVVRQEAKMGGGDLSFKLEPIKHDMLEAPKKAPKKKPETVEVDPEGWRVRTLSDDTEAQHQWERQRAEVIRMTRVHMTPELAERQARLEWNALYARSSSPK